MMGHCAPILLAPTHFTTSGASIKVSASAELGLHGARLIPSGNKDCISSSRLRGAVPLIIVLLPGSLGFVAMEKQRRKPTPSTASCPPYGSHNGCKFPRFLFFFTQMFSFRPG